MIVPTFRISRLLDFASEKELLKKLVPGFQGEISKDKGVDIEVGKDH